MYGSTLSFGLNLELVAEPEESEPRLVRTQAVRL